MSENSFDTTETKEYLRKLDRVIKREADFSIFEYKFVKKIKVDDVLCCIIATLPKPYKMVIDFPQEEKFNSIIAYNMLLEATRRKFIFDSNIYCVNSIVVSKYISAMLRDIDRDLNRIISINN